MVQDTLRVTGLSRQRNPDTATVADRTGPLHLAAAAAGSSTDKDKQKDKKPKDDSKRGLKVTFTRKPKLSISGRGDTVDPKEEDRPFMGSLRQASMSSPVLPLFSNPFALPADSPAASTSNHATNNSPLRPRASTRRSSTSRDKEREPINPSQISRPRVLAPAASPTTPTSATGSRGISPSPQRNRSPPPKLTRFPSISTSHIPTSPPTQRAISPGYHSRNTSTTSLTSPSPYREIIRTASSLLIKHLSRPPPPLRQQDWQDVEVRLRALSRLERIWGRSGGGSSATAVGSGSGFGGGEDRERRLFCEAVRDGYVLCALLNKFRPGTVARPDPKEDGFTKTSNITKFLAGALHYGVSNSDLFFRNDMLEASGESLARVAQTIVALVKLGEPALPPHGSSRGLYMSIRDGSASSPNLLDSGQQRSSSVNRPGRSKRYSPPSALPPVPGSSQGRPPSSQETRQNRANSLTPSPIDFAETVRSNSPQVPPRSPLRPSLSSRASLNSSITDSTAGFSMLDNRSSARFGTVRTTTTMATSIHPPENASVALLRQESKLSHSEPAEEAQPVIGYQTQFTELPTTSRRRSYDRDASAARLAQAISQSPTTESGPLRQWRERRSSELPSNDLSNVEEVDEMGTRRGRQFVEVATAFSSLDPTSTASAATPARGPSFDRPRLSFEIPPQGEVDLSSSPPRPKAGLPMRRPVHGHRHSVDTVTTSPMPILIPRHSSLSKERERQPSPSSSRESTTPSPPGGGIRPAIAPRRSSSRVSPRGSYVPKINGIDDPRALRRKHSTESDQIETTPTSPGMPRVPFPRTTSGDFAPAISGTTAGVSRLAALPVSSSGDLGGHEEASTANGNPGSPRRASGSSNAVRPIQRVRYNSELDTTGTRTARKHRPTSLDEPGAGIRPGRSRFESMMNLGSVGDTNSTESSLSVNAIRQPLVVREEGKPPMHYQIGNGIGRGQFGAVYRALNLNTGQMVAVKRISLQGLSEDEISNLMKEVDVLKRLSHPSIVKYEGMVRSTDTLSIVLEYVENGSLGQTLKAFGKLNERLVASYVTKILEGLHYLHTSHVVHCDLKAANILTTKNGNVKLSDFGVSLNLNAKALEEIKNDVAGTPNWMAPEVIELKGASTASDIWSLGCTAIELLTGHPPYHEIGNGMSVMFKIVDDDIPPIPDVCSPLMKEFLKQCFKKDPAQRPSAETLFEHPWLKTAWGEHRELRPQDSIPFLRRVSVELARSEATRSLSLDTKSVAPSESFSADGGLKPSSTTPQVGIPIPLTPLSPDSSEGPTRPHSFIKTTFGRAVLCRVCHQSVKRSAVLCEDCGLIAHARCAADAPPSCDIRAQLLLYSQYSQASNSQELASPVRESASPASSPIAIPPSPGMRPRARRQSDATFSSSPKLSERLLPWKRSNKVAEPASPPAPTLSSSPAAYHPPRDEATTPTPMRPLGKGPLSANGVGPSASSGAVLSTSPEKLRKRSRLSFSSNANTDSVRSMVTAAETVSSTPSYDSTPRSSVAPAGRRPTLTSPQRPMMTVTAATQGSHNNTPATTEENGVSETTTAVRRLATRMSTVSINASEFGEERRRIKRNQRESVSSKNDQCIVF